MEHFEKESKQAGASDAAASAAGGSAKGKKGAAEKAAAPQKESKPFSNPERTLAYVEGIRNESDLKEPVRLVLDLKRDADAEVVLNQLYQFSPLQELEMPGPLPKGYVAYAQRYMLWLA